MTKTYRILYLNKKSGKVIAGNLWLEKNKEKAEGILKNKPDAFELVEVVKRKGISMSTNDVPGANPANKDVLAMGCWAEHEDGSLIFVESVEAGRVVYSIFDVAQDPPVEYRDAMPEAGFKTRFTWKPRAKDMEKWTWHDKTPFPWEDVMHDFPSGEKYVQASDELSAAQRVAQSLHLRAERVRERENVKPSIQRAATTIMQGIREAISALKE